MQRVMIKKKRISEREMFLTVWTEVFVRAVRTVLLPIAGVGDVDAAAVIALELVV